MSGGPCGNNKGASTTKTGKVIKDSGNKKNGKNEPVILASPWNRKCVDPLCSSAPKSTIKTAQLSICMVHKPVHGMWTPLSLGSNKIIPLNSPVIIVNDSAQKITSINLRIHSTSNLMLLSKHIEKTRNARHCKSSFILPISTILETLWLSVYHLIVCPFTKCKSAKKTPNPKQWPWVLCKRSSSGPPQHSTLYVKCYFEIPKCN